MQIKSFFHISLQHRNLATAIYDLRDIIRSACSMSYGAECHPRAITRTCGIDWSSGVALECLKGPKGRRRSGGGGGGGGGTSRRRYYSCYLSSRMYVGRQSGTLVQKCHPHAASIKDFYGSVACHRASYVRVYVQRS